MAATGRLGTNFARRRRRSAAIRAVLAALLFSVFIGSSTYAFDAGRASFSVRINDEIIPYNVFAIYVLPGEQLEIEASGSEQDEFQISGGGNAQALAPRRWSWRAPQQPGLYDLRISSALDSVQLNAFVLRPASAVVDGRIENFRVGQYPETPLNGNPVYLPPDGFVELNDSTASVMLSPHFQLSQFPSKQSGSFPKYLVLRERLLLKLELLLEQLNSQGISAESLTIMSGYRTPFYNQAIGNVPYSRHVYGGAADVFVDVAPRDGIMDDLNQDGVHDYRDAQMLYSIANRLYASDSNRWLVGGLGVYRSNSAHGPFLHIDARGMRSRWGVLP